MFHVNPLPRIHCMKYQLLLSLTMKKKYSRLSPAAVVIGKILVILDILLSFFFIS